MWSQIIQFSRFDFQLAIKIRESEYYIKTGKLGTKKKRLISVICKVKNVYEKVEEASKG